jgi:hypothetical protein
MLIESIEMLIDAVKEPPNPTRAWVNPALGGTLQINPYSIVYTGQKPRSQDSRSSIPYSQSWS